MAPAEKKTKELAQRVDPAYFARPHPFRRRRRVITWSVFGLSFLWIAYALAASDARLYSAGPVSEGHALFEQDCARCHAEAFGSVRDESCMVCHRVTPHVPANKGTDPSCAGCHFEHRGRHALGVVENSHCDACHEDHGGVSSFADHPEFSPKPIQQNLKFNHAAHLRPDLKEGPLDCASCHAPDRAGEGFATIGHVAHCAKCHALGFDVDYPDARLPHGLAASEMKLRIEAFYVGVLREDAPVEDSGRSPVPGRDPAAPPDWLATLDRKTQGALRVLGVPGRNSGCFQCHVAASDGIAVAPPDVPDDWLSARFSHASHRTESCATCHAMAANERADSVVLPGVESCRTCHKPGGASSACVTCHAFHPR